ncbi:hypothetical protein GCK72_011184 [Caenorhabditis remanei]|uniref:Uncharacterized protein n=1 Tax=Caenorhabditis remanei TaxID=31234 RepID=A0A6A5H4X6_CAERE|nr:hypothetical protein GCK72_011184 [Caenorhabditis remanei]KAF1762920.1 hypothetical protein GCK72_011184 [Caenorhabditis remanei]
MNRKLKTLAEWQVLQNKMVVLENRQDEENEGILREIREERRRLEARRRARHQEELERQQKELCRQILETIRNIKEMKENKRTEGLERERRNGRAICRRFHKVCLELRALKASERDE